LVVDGGRVEQRVRGRDRRTARHRLSISVWIRRWPYQCKTIHLATREFIVGQHWNLTYFFAIMPYAVVSQPGEGDWYHQWRFRTSLISRATAI